MPYMALSGGSTAVSSLTTLGDVITQIMNWFSTVLSTISGEPLLLLGIGIFVASAVIYLTYKALHGRG